MLPLRTAAAAATQYTRPPPAVLLGGAGLAHLAGSDGAAAVAGLLGAFLAVQVSRLLAGWVGKAGQWLRLALGGHLTSQGPGGPRGPPYQSRAR